MWKEAAQRAFPEAKFADPVDRPSLRAAERRLGRRIPDALTDLLQETNGISGPYALATVWPLERIVEDNLSFWSEPTFVDLYMPFEPLLFFGDNGGGDQFAFVRVPDGRHDVFVWEHEDDSRRWVARDLHDYLNRSLSSEGDDWYQ
ncbi:SMI1/KNR4 family protein [Streptomyces sp. NPDC050548]|uniref:SMI1/KNR4 family protein n=1 Tax=Streptomyces sp. NPDC050548 TaxID=3365629 RepID=UPI0037A50A23